MTKARVVCAWVLLSVSVVGWPLSQLTVARSEPTFTLGLSWLAIILTATDIIQTTNVRRETAGDGNGNGSSDDSTDR
jgi:hypothetical protein